MKTLLLWALVTAYCPCEKCCGRHACGLTASGAPAVGKIIAAPKRFAFGTIVDVPFYGRAMVRDRGAKIRGNHFDVLFPTHAEAIQWGARRLQVTIYKKGGKP